MTLNNCGSAATLYTLHSSFAAPSRLYTIHLTPENSDIFAIYLHLCKKSSNFAGKRERNKKNQKNAKK